MKNSLPRMILLVFCLNINIQAFSNILNHVENRTEQNISHSIDYCDIRCWKLVSEFIMTQKTIINDLFKHFDTSIDTEICEDSSPFLLNGQNIQTENESIFQTVLNNPTGCDSIVMLDADVTSQSNIVTDSITICIQDVPAVWNGNEYKADGLYSDTLSTAAGADSIVQLRLILIPEIKPTFDQLGPYCRFARPDNLPNISKEGITGSWIISINTSELGNQPLTFTPYYGQCAKPVIMEIEVKANITPAIESIGPFCENSVPPPLPTVTLNNLTGTWNPSSIDTKLVMNRTYRFTPDLGQCSPDLEVDIEILPIVIPTFDSIGPLYQNSTPPKLPKVSTNGVTGRWNPAVIETSNIGTTTYNYIPDPGNCVTEIFMEISVEKATSIETSSNNDFNINVFPNPNNGVFDIEISGITNNEICIELIDVSGRIIDRLFLEKLSSGFIKQNINQQGLASGIYYLNIEAGKERTTKEIIVR